MSIAFDLIAPLALLVLAGPVVRQVIRRDPPRYRVARELDPGYHEVRQALRGLPRGRVPVTHLWPPGVGRDYLTPCCGRDPLALPGNDKFTYDADAVDCPSMLPRSGS